MNKLIQIAFVVVVLILTSCATQQPFYHSKVSDWENEQPGDRSDLVYEVFLIGDSRKLIESNAVWDLMDSQLSAAGKNSAIVFLGDNVQHRGLPDSTHRKWNIARKSLDAHLQLLTGYKGEIYFLPGNHDWALGGKDGLDRVKNQRKYIEQTLDRKDVFLPKKGRPGPEEIHLTDDIVLMILDSQWWFHENEKSYSGIEDEADLFVQIEDIVSRNRDKKIIVATHHPLYSVGHHGGHFEGSRLLFPLLDVHPGLYLPLPGFLYTGYRKFLGGKQDLVNPHYELLRRTLMETFEGHTDIIFAAGHEHNLQYVEKEGIHHIVSGAGSMATYVAQSDKTEYAQMAVGLAKLGFYSSGDVWLEFMTAGNNPSFRKKLYHKPVFKKQEIEAYLNDIDYSDSTRFAYPNGEKFKAGKFKKLMLGNNYREEWMIPVEVPVFDFNKEKGGLEIIKKGGGKQTKSLRLENSDEKQYVLRSLEKDPSKAIPDAINIQFAIDIVQDQMSASLPWAALSVPRLADAAEIYHANPKVVYLTKDPRLGAYQDDVWEGLYLFEERGRGDRRDVESFGRSKEMVGTPDMFDEIEDDHDNQMDQAHFLKCRLFDVFINDFDRHEDQWTWATFDKNGDGKIYRAVPRDRDQTFFYNEGLLSWISSRKAAYRINQPFDHEIKDMGGVISQARRLDRRFLNELEKEDWISAGKKMQASFTDDLLYAAVHDMPAEITASCGEEIFEKLKSRRDQLPDFAAAHYSIISKKVDIIGSNKREQFEVVRLNDHETEVKMWSVSKEGRKKDKIYDRTFDHRETSEIRLYGLEGKDEFDVEGKVNKGIRVRIIGGADKDDIKDKSKVRGPGKKTLIYDTKKKNDIEFGTEARDRTSNLPEKNSYNYAAFNYNKFLPLAFTGYNADEALIIGAGFKYTTHGFQKSPHASHHSVGGRYITATNAFEFEYDGEFRSIIRRLDLNFHFIVRNPRYAYNYFGMGNETSKTQQDKDYHRVRIGQVYVFPEITRSFGKSTFGAGVFFRQYKVENTPGRYISDTTLNGLTGRVFDEHQYAGIGIRYLLDTRDNEVFPTRGVYWNSYTLFNYCLSESASTYDRLSTDFRWFLSFTKPHRLVIALRAGAEINAGNYQFHQAATLGGKQNLRGYRSNRYAGDASFYHNTDLRFKLFDFTTYISKAEFGILAFNDIGRIWLGGEVSDVWHHGYGGGLWTSLFKLSILSATFERSKDEPSGLFSFRFRFLF